jgi:hypothetical protein
MNPVDHPHGVREINLEVLETTKLTNNRVVTINISVRPLRSRDTLHKVKRLVSLLLGELVCCVVLRRSRIRWDESLFLCFGLAGFASLYPTGRIIARMNERNAKYGVLVNVNFLAELLSLQSYVQMQSSAGSRSSFSRYNAYVDKATRANNIV